jgi:hypothetical protein
MALKTVFFLFTLLLSTGAGAHGEIQSISCTSTSNPSVKLTGQAEQDPNKHTIVLHDGSSQKSEAGLTLNLRDTVQKGQVIENIEFSLRDGTQVHLMIPEITEKKRSGSGLIKPAQKGEKTKTIPLTCTVVY